MAKTILPNAQVTSEIMINGQAYNWASIIVTVLGVPVKGITSINYSTKQDVQNIYGAGALPVSYSYNNRTFDASITISMKELATIRRAAIVTGLASICDIPAFDIIVTYTPSLTTVPIVDTIVGCRIMEDTVGANQNDAEINVTIPVLPKNIIYTI